MNHTQSLNAVFSKPQQWFIRDDRRCRNLLLDCMAQLHTLSPEHHCWTLSQSDELYCDTLWIGPENASNVLVIISGTHGVEGFCGSAVQRFLLDHLHKGDLELPDNCALLIIHALNPWGMRNARRCDQSGIDLNRNFIDFNQLPPKRSEYDSCLQQLMQTPPGERYSLLQTFAEQFGQSEFDQLFSGGQYHCPWGPYYGGDAPSWSNKVIEEIISGFELNQKTMLVIDVHSGLGPWGFGELICDHPAGSNGELFAQSLFGPAIASVEAGNSFSAPKLGLMDYRWHKLMQQSGCFLTLEFGSYGTEALFEVLFNDHLLWQHKTHTESAELAQQQQAMLEHFCPAQTLWQQSVLFKAWQVVSEGLKRLNDVGNA